MKNKVRLRSKNDIITFTTRDWLVRSVRSEGKPHRIGYTNYMGYFYHTNIKFPCGLLPIFKI